MIVLVNTAQICGDEAACVKQNKSRIMFESGEHMDIHLLRTFLAVAEHEGLRKAAEFLHLTPSAVSSRVRQLEREIGIQLFDRSRNGVGLTPAGYRLKERAEGLIQDWSNIRQDVLRRDEHDLCLRIGATDVIWQIWLQSKLGSFMAVAPDSRFILRTGGRSELARMLINGALDGAVLTQEIKYPGISCQRVSELELIPVRSTEVSDEDAAGLSGFVDIDWGDRFRNRMMKATHLTPDPAADVNVAWLGMEWLLRFGGTAWLPGAMIEEHLRQGRLHQIAGVKSISLGVYAALNKENDVAYSMLRNMLLPGDSTGI
ncbi:LysR family transcriptional regulator [Mariprofundus ferrooxydans]|uniref:Transcriptional regulator, LysR family protein n=2 Tax=Mariprofundus ferrooxydans TaxID=314344 RepID=Q0F002_9PROT|nr:transcriptional regulator, LysR family protein [Mariprofundus ferrooxydans PV-1]KON46806.1 LysR family transcriptional regulator [Mariprofundus ferrooxydans]